MPVAVISGFSGIDTRRLREASDARTARVARNLDLTAGREYMARDGLRFLQHLHPQSKGLYTLGNTLRSVIPGGQGYPLEDIGAVPVKYDQLGFGTGYFSSIMVSMLNEIRSGVNTGTARLENADWPDDAVGRTLNINDGELTATITGLDAASRTVTLSAVFPGTPGLYPFALGGSPPQVSRTITIPNGSDEVTLTGGVWPEGIEGSSFSVVTRGFSSSIVSRLSTTKLRLAKQNDQGQMTGVDFSVSGVVDTYPNDTLVRVAGVESVGANASFGVYPYLVVERWVDPANHGLGSIFEHHWITRPTTDPTVPIATQVNLPFAPGPSIIKAAGKLWASDDVNGVVRFSSTANGPKDWTTPQDAGYIPVISHASGDRRIRGLGIYDDKLAVIFTDAVQLWAVDPQPSNITIVRIINGPGTDQPRSVVNVLGDLFYFTRGGFRSMHMQTVTGQIQEQDDIGIPVDQITKDETGEASVALWSQARGQYLCAFENRVYAFRYAPKSKVQGWTTWEFDVPVDAITELDGVTYVRSGNDLYQLDPTYDDGSEWELVLNDFTAKDAAVRKRADFIEVIQRGTCDVRVYLEPDNDTYYLDGPRIAGSSIQLERVFLGAQSRVFGFRFSGTGRWTLAALRVEYKQLPW